MPGRAATVSYNAKLPHNCICSELALHTIYGFYRCPSLWGVQNCLWLNIHVQYYTVLSIKERLLYLWWNSESARFKNDSTHISCVYQLLISFLPFVLFSSTFLYLKFLGIWATVLLFDFLLEFRFEYLWPVWLLIRSIYDSYKYQGLVSSPFDSFVMRTLYGMYTSSVSPNFMKY